MITTSHSTCALDGNYLATFSSRHFGRARLLTYTTTSHRSDAAASARHACESNSHGAEDILQEAFVRGLGKLADLRDDESIEAMGISRPTTGEGLEIPRARDHSDSSTDCRDVHRFE